jgi:hypothetical protein
MDSSRNYTHRIDVPSKTPLARLLPSHEQKVGLHLLSTGGPDQLWRRVEKLFGMLKQKIL